MPNILVIDDQTLFTALLTPVLEDLDEQVVVYEAASIKAGLDILEALTSINLILLELEVANEHTWETFPFSNRQLKSVPIIILTASTNRTDLETAIEKGCKGYITKFTSKRQFITGINKILGGQTYFPTQTLAAVENENKKSSNQGHQFTAQFKNLSDRQNEILTYLSRGHTNREIARLCGIAEGTVKLHVSTILKALGVSNRTQAVIKANQLNNASHGNSGHQ